VEVEMSDDLVFKCFEGKYVVVRSNQTGVVWGLVTRAIPGGVELAPGSRKAHFWRQAGAQEGLAVIGPARSGGRITFPSVGPRVMGTNAQVVDILVCTDEANEAWRTADVWTGRE